MSMTCPQCGAWAQVKETRTNKDKNVVTRRYECGNMHRFSTEEKVKCTAAKDQTAKMLSAQAAPPQ